MSELIDRQALRAAHGIGSDCHDCKRDMKSCQYDRDYSLMDFCEWLDDAPTASPWHRADEELPKYGDWVLCLGPKGGYYVSEYRGVSGLVGPRFHANGRYINATHWMPLPEPPKEEENDNNKM